MRSLRCLIITTSSHKSDNSDVKTGVWMEDIAGPYFVFKDSGEFITIASPLGGRIPLDDSSNRVEWQTDNTKRFEKNAQAMYHFTHALPLNEIRAQDYDLVFISGGYGAMADFQNNIPLQALLNDFYYQNKPIGLVGHAVVALIGFSINTHDSFVKNRKLTAFSNTEESSIGLEEKPPFLLESRLLSSGALYSKGPDFLSNVVIDGSIVTGQNPASSVEAAKQILSLAHKQHQ
jgi:putative intracellular protease/amidase